MATSGENGSKFKRIAVYCGSSNGVRPEYVEAAVSLGEEMCRRGIKLVYGGGNVGLMGAVSRTCAAGLGEDSIIGVIPEALRPREISGEMWGDLRVVSDIHQRKQIMADEADAFIALPGGFGTLEELLEMVTWQQLGFHTKPVGVLNCCRYYTKLLKFMDHITAEGFVRSDYRKIVVSADTPAELLDALEAYTPPQSLVKVLASEQQNGAGEEKS